MTLKTHAEFEMRRAGLYDKDADYGGMIPAAVMELIEAHARQGHSGMSHYLVMDIFKKLVNFKPLTPITSDPEEWHDVSEYGGPTGKPIHQSSRSSSLFSNDGGKTYYDIDGPRSRFVFVRQLRHFIRPGRFNEGGFLIHQAYNNAERQEVGK